MLVRSGSLSVLLSRSRAYRVGVISDERVSDAHGPVKKTCVSMKILKKT